MPFPRKVIAGAGVTAAIAVITLAPSPAQAAAAGSAKVSAATQVTFKASTGSVNALTITVSGRTVTLDDKVAIKAGAGCKAVPGDKTKVKCTTSKTPTRIVVSLGDKNDTVLNNSGIAMSALGGPGDDTMTGGSRGDVLRGEAGVDKLAGGRSTGPSGDDDIDGGAGNDTILGFNGDDVLKGGAGNDGINGHLGHDAIDGGAGNDWVNGAEGDDMLSGGAGNDTLIGLYGDDLVSGDPGADSIRGDHGDDLLIGGEGNDSIEGYVGEDMIYGSAGDDELYGGPDDDFLVGEGQSGESDKARDFLHGGTELPDGGDICVVLAAGTTEDCELDEDGGILDAAAVVAGAASDAVRAATVR